MSLAFVVDPNHAILLLLCGILLLYAEFNKPGTVVLGCLGALAVMFAIYGLGQFPLRPSALVVLAAGIALVVLGVTYPLRQSLPLAGMFLLIFGLGRLVVAPAINNVVAIGTAVLFTVVTNWLLRAALQARRNKSLVGPHTMIGKLGTVHTPLAPAGQVRIRGELWQAVLAESTFAAKGASVVVRGVRDLELSVVAFKPQAPALATRVD